MDLSALIFVALAVAWAVYLIPMALRAHEEDAVSRPIDGFSDRLRVLARREAISATQAELVPARRAKQPPAAPAAPAAAPAPEPEGSTETSAAPTPAPRVRSPRTAEQRTARRAAARRAAARRRRVFNILAMAIVVVLAFGIGKIIGLVWTAIPVALMAAWLVACRLMVRSERAARTSNAPVRKRRRTLADEVIDAERGSIDAAASDESLDVLSDDTDEVAVVEAELDEPVAGGWTPVPVPLPTYVAKAPATRTVRTIDLDSTGVWSSGRNDADSELAREADAQRARSEAEADVDERRALGS